jgi:hypothetical protein
MSGLFRRWFGGAKAAAGAPAWPKVRRWAEAAGQRFAVGRGEQGFVIEAQRGSAACRVEWGPSQRSYIGTHELRVRADIGGGADLQMLAVTRELLKRLEHDVFEQATEGTETRIDGDTPEEMRWVVIYPQVPSKQLGVLHGRFGLLANRPRAATLWLEEGLAQPLAASVAWHDPAAPMALVVQRGRFVLRLGLATPRVAAIDGALTLGLAAAAAARRVGDEVARGGVSSQRPSTWGPAPARSEEPTDF